MRHIVKFGGFAQPCVGTGFERRCISPLRRRGAGLLLSTAAAVWQLSAGSSACIAASGADEFRPGLSEMDLAGASGAALSFGIRRIGPEKGRKVWPQLYRVCPRIPHAAFFRLAHETINFGAVSTTPEDLDSALPATCEQTWCAETSVVELGGGGTLSVTAGRLSPAVLIRSSAARLNLFGKMEQALTVYPWTPAELAERYEKYRRYLEGKGRALKRTSGLEIGGLAQCTTYSLIARPQYVAFVNDMGRLAAYDGDKLEEAGGGSAAAGLGLLGEPWILAWFGGGGHIIGSREPDAGRPVGSGGGYFMTHEGRLFDMPVLILLERNPIGLALSDSGLQLSFAAESGATLLLLPFGGRLFEPGETEAWSEQGPPAEVVERCRAWARRLRAVPLAAAESYVARENGDVTVRNQFEYLEIKDDWDTPITAYAPLPSMLGLALHAGMPLQVSQAGAVVRPEDWGWLDYAGLALAVPGRELEFTVPLSRWTAVPAAPGSYGAGAAGIRERLEAYVADMLDAGHLAPYFQPMGILDHEVFFYWAGFGELAEALAAAAPHLPAPLQDKVKAYLLEEFRRYPHLELSKDFLLAGARREPYLIEPAIREMDAVFWLNAVEHAAETCRQYHREQGLLRDMRGYAEYLRLTGDTEGLGELAPKLRDAFWNALDLGHFDWSLGGPGKGNCSYRHMQQDGHRFLRGAAFYNAAAAGLVGYARLQAALGDRAEADLAQYVLARLLPTRIALAAYPRALHEYGLCDGEPEFQARQVFHADEMALLLGQDGRIHRHEHETDSPAFIGLTRETALAMRDSVRGDTARYLGFLDVTRPLWFLCAGPPMIGHEEERITTPEQYGGNFLAHAWALQEPPERLMRYLDETKFRGDLCYIRNLCAVLEAYGKTDGR